MAKLTNVTGNDIRRARELVGLEPQHFSHVLGIHSSTLYRWEKSGPAKLRIDPASLALLVALNSYLSRLEHGKRPIEDFRAKLLEAVLTGGTLKAIHCLLSHYFQDSPGVATSYEYTCSLCKDSNVCPSCAGAGCAQCRASGLCPYCDAEGVLECGDGDEES